MMRGKMKEIMDNSVCQWCYGRDCHGILSHRVHIGSSSLWYSQRASIQYAASESNGREVAIVGECLDVTNAVDRQGIAHALCRLDSEGFELFIENLCGVYVILRSECGAVKVYGDAMHMMSVYYGVEDKSGIVASCEALIVNDVSAVSEKAQEVLAGAYEAGLYLAGDMTMYDDVRALLPNHRLDVVDRQVRAVRYFPREKLSIARTRGEIDEIIEKTSGFVKNAIVGFSQFMRFASPLTPGADSRVNCAFLNDELPQDEVLYYVIDNEELKSQPKNRSVVKKVAEHFGFRNFHFYPECESFTEEFVDKVNRLLGPTRVWVRKIWAYHPEIAGRTIVSGAMIGHILGGTLGRNMPKWMVRPWFVRIAQRNVSDRAAKETDKWCGDAMDGVGKGYSLLDLWTWEIRCGRWNANTASRNNIYGIQNINFYNSHSIISEWCRIPRRLRVRKVIHKRILQRIAPSVADIEINPCINKYSTHIPVCMIRFVPLWIRAIGAHIISKWRLGK